MIEVLNGRNVRHRSNSCAYPRSPSPSKISRNSLRKFARKPCPSIIQKTPQKTFISNHFLLHISGLVSKPSHEGQAPKNGHGMAVRHVHGPNSRGHPAGCSRDTAAVPVPWRTWPTPSSPGPELSSGRGRRLLRGQIYAVSGVCAHDKRFIPSPAASAHSGCLPGAPSSPSTSPLAAAATFIRLGRSYGRQYRLPDEQPTHERGHHLQADHVTRT